MEVVFQNHAGKALPLTRWPLMLQDEEKLLKVSRSYASTERRAEGITIDRWFKRSQEFSLTVAVFADSAEAFYNLGNAQFKQQKYKEALESYKQSLRLNPSDMEAKYNYAYTKRLLDENKDGGGGGNDDKDQNKDQNQQNKDRNQQNQDQQNKDQQNKDQKGDPKDRQDDGKQDPQDNKGDKGDQQGQPTPSGISPQEQQQMLDAIQAQEDKTQEKLKEKQGVVVRGKKNW